MYYLYLDKFHISASLHWQLLFNVECWKHEISIVGLSLYTICKDTLFLIVRKNLKKRF